MPYAQWKGSGNSATRHRIRQIKWTRRDKLGAVIISLLALATALVSAWLSSNTLD